MIKKAPLKRLYASKSGSWDCSTVTFYLQIHIYFNKSHRIWPDDVKELNFSCLPCTSETDAISNVPTLCGLLVYWNKWPHVCFNITDMNKKGSAETKEAKLVRNGVSQQFRFNKPYEKFWHQFRIQPQFWVPLRLPLKKSAYSMTKSPCLLQHSGQQSLFHLCASLFRHLELIQCSLLLSCTLSSTRNPR